MPITPESTGRGMSSKTSKSSKGSYGSKTDAEIQFELEAEADAKRRKIQVCLGSRLKSTFNRDVAGGWLTSSEHVIYAEGKRYAVKDR
jgi:hypothetical protein